MRLTKKLLGYLHRKFSKDAEPFLALRLRYNGAMAWTVRDGYLYTIVSGGTGHDLAVELAPYTLSGLVGYLASQPGYSVVFSSATHGDLSARVLLDASSDIANSNGDHLYGYESTLFAWLEPAAAELTEAKRQIVEMLKQMSTRSGSNEWLDELGDYYDVRRAKNESDESYGPRIIAEVLRPRGNNVAIERAIWEFTGQQVSVEDVIIYGDTFPLYNGAISRNSGFNYNASSIKRYGLFDVTIGYDLGGTADIEAFKGIVTDLVNRLRDAGTHMRSLLLSGSELSDTFDPPTDGGPDIQLRVGAPLSDNFTAPIEVVGVRARLQNQIDILVIGPSDAGSMVVNYNYRYNSLRRYNGGIRRMGVQSAIESF